MKLTNFDYQITNLKQKGKKNIKVTFDYLNHKVTYELSLKENSKFKESDYLNEAKEIINQEIKNGELVKYADKYLKSHNVKLPLFTDFAYSLVPSSLEGYKEVQVMLTYQKQRVTTYAFIKEEANKGKEYYLNEAEKKINAEARDGRLLKEVKKFINPEKGKAKGPKIALVCVSAVALALGGLIIYHFANQKGTYTVSVDPNGGAFEEHANGEHSYAIHKYEVKPGSTWQELKKEKDIEISIMPQEGATFVGWQYYEVNHWANIPVTPDGIIFNSDTLIKANYNYSGDMAKVIVNPGTGVKWSDGTSGIKTVQVANGSTWVDIKDQFAIDESTILSKYKHEYTYQSYEGDKPDPDERWTDIGDGYVLRGTVNIRINYVPKMVTIDFVDKYNGYEDDVVPGGIMVKVDDTEWYEARRSIDRPNVKNGYRFLDYYFTNASGSLIPVPDTMTFKENRTFELMWDIQINFKQPVSETDIHGELPYGDYWITSGTKWSDIKNKFSPIPDEGYEFAGFKDAQGNEVNDDYVINHYTTFVASYKPASADSFEHDSWATFLDIITNKLWGQLIDPASPYYDEYMSDEGKEKGTFVGLTRTIRMHNRDYTVRVIDENFTHFFESGGQQKRKLAFEFVNTLNYETPYAQLQDETKINHYEDSNISTYLNGVVFDALPIELQTALNKSPTTVEYYAIDPDDPATGEMNEVEQKLFPLSAYELNFDKYPPIASGETGEEVKEEGGHIYKFYEKGGSRKKSANPGFGLQQIYWTRSADINYIYGAWQVDQAGVLGVLDTTDDLRYSENITDTLAVAPAFEL